MAKTKRLTTITAGRLVYGVCYTAALPRDKGQQRAAKLQASSAARQKLNLKLSWRKLELVMAANFELNALFVTLTYDDEHLPPSRREAVRAIKAFLTQLRAERRRHGNELKYIYCTEGSHGNARLHHHLVINGTGSDYELIRALWSGGDNVSFETIDDYGYEALAKYMTKEAREEGSPNGARTWIPSRGLVHPEPCSEWVDENLDLVPPPGAVVLESEAPKINTYGSFTYYKYLLPPPKVRKARPKAKKSKKDALYSDLEHCISSEKGERNQCEEVNAIANGNDMC